VAVHQAVKPAWEKAVEPDGEAALGSEHEVLLPAKHSAVDGCSYGFGGHQARFGKGAFALGLASGCEGLLAYFTAGKARRCNQHTYAGPIQFGPQRLQKPIQSKLGSGIPTAGRQASETRHRRDPDYPPLPNAHFGQGGFDGVYGPPEVHFKDFSQDREGDLFYSRTVGEACVSDDGVKPAKGLQSLLDGLLACLKVAHIPDEGLDTARVSLSQLFQAVLAASLS